MVSLRGSASRPLASKARALLTSFRLLSGAHGVIRTPIFLPVTFVLIRSQGGYMRILGLPAGSDPASACREHAILATRRWQLIGSPPRNRTSLNSV